MQAGQPGFDIAAQGAHHQIGTAVQNLGRPAQRRGAYHRARRQIGQTGCLGRQEGVAAILAFQHRGKDEAVLQAGRHVLAGMDGDIDARVGQRLVDFAGEQSLAADFGQGSVLNSIARGSDGDNVGRACLRQGGMTGGETAFHHASLGQSQGAAAGADAEKSGRVHGR